MERLLREAHELARQWWDPGLRLLTHPGGLLGGRYVGRAEQVGLLPATVWWAYGLLRRGRPGDRELAEVAVREVVDRQGDASDADPDERLAVAVALALLLRDHDLPATLAVDVGAAVERAVDAEQDRVLAVALTDAAVKRAWLELEVGRRRSDEELLTSGAELARAVAADAGVRGHVAEHNSPTATGNILLGLSLWTERPPVEHLAPLGRALRDEVWHDLLASWHPGLRTIVPPFARAHGMDLRAHVGATALWLAWLVDGVEPVPPLHEGDLDQAQELPLVFLVDALAGASDDVRDLAPLVRAQPARQGEWYDRVGERVWTGWTGGTLAAGAEWSPVDHGGAWQEVTAAAVWVGDGGTAWLRLHQEHGEVEARVEREDGVVRLVHGTTNGPVELWVGGPGAWALTPEELTDGVRSWRLHGVVEAIGVDRDVPHVEAAWRLTVEGDGVVLVTDADD